MAECKAKLTLLYQVQRHATKKKSWQITNLNKIICRKTNSEKRYPNDEKITKTSNLITIRMVCKSDLGKIRKEKSKVQTQLMFQ